MPPPPAPGAGGMEGRDTGFTHWDKTQWEIGIREASLTLSTIGQCLSTFLFGLRLCHIKQRLDANWLQIE